MKDYFVWAMAALIPLGVLGYFLYMLGKGLYGMYSDWRLHGELDELQAQQSGRKQARAEANQRRLDNGCQHDFGGALGGFPPDVCHKCGLSREKPAGSCDHVWKAGEGPVPHSICAKCGKTYNPAMRRESLT